MLDGLHPVGRCGTPEEVAEYTVFVLSDHQRHVTGQSLFMDGGSSMTSSISYSSLMRSAAYFTMSVKGLFQRIKSVDWI